MLVLFNLVIFYGVWRYSLALFEVGWNLSPLIEAIAPVWYHPIFVFIG